MKCGVIVLMWVLAATLAHGNGYERFEENGKVGIRDNQGHVVLPPAFDALGWSDGSFSVLGEITGYRKGNLWGLINLRKEFVTEPNYLSLTSAGGNAVRISRVVNTLFVKYGCINLRGEEIIPAMYDDILPGDLRAVVMVKDGTRYKYGLIDLNNRTLLPLTYQQITPLGTLRYAVRNIEGKTALYSDAGKWVTGFDIDSLSSFQNGLAILYRGNHKGLIDRNGEVVLEPAYRYVDLTNPESIRVRKADTWKIIDASQKALHETEADLITPLGLNRYRITLSEKSGIVDSLFRTIVPIEYDYVGTVAHEKFIAGVAGRYGLMRTDQTFILPLRFDTLIQEGHLLRARTVTQGRVSWDVYDTVGVRKTSVGYDFLGNPAHGLYPAWQKGFSGAVDRTGVEKVACVYDSLLEISDENVVVKFKGQYGIVTHQDVWKVLPQPIRLKVISSDRYLEVRDSLKVVKDFTGETIYFTDNPLRVDGDHFLENLPDGTTKAVRFNGTLIERTSSETVRQASGEPAVEHEGLTLVKRHGKYGFIDNRGRLRIANRYEDAGDFNEGLAPVRLVGKWGFIDKAEQIVVQPVYDKRPVLMHGVAVVIRNGKSGIIDREGNTRLELRYDSIRRIDDDTFLLYQGGTRGLADGQGKILLEPRFDSLIPIEGERVIVGQSGQFGLLTRDGLSLFPMRYDALVYQPQTKTFFARVSYPWEPFPPTVRGGLKKP